MTATALKRRVIAARKRNKSQQAHREKLYTKKKSAQTQEIRVHITHTGVCLNVSVYVCIGICKHIRTCDYVARAYIGLSELVAAAFVVVVDFKVINKIVTKCCAVVVMLAIVVRRTLACLIDKLLRRVT